MILHSMTATFGKLRNETLTLAPGLNLFSGPNEAGKSTWCAFLVAMLYGFPSRERDKKGAPAERTRYRPWNGAPMEGAITCTFDDRPMTLRRSWADGSPGGKFVALYDDTGQEVPGLTGDNVGRRLLGVGREVFARSLLIRQSQLAVSENPELEERIAALLSSGEEGVSWTQADGRLREWLRARRFQKSGRIPQLEAQCQALEEQLSQVSGLWQQRLFLEETIDQEENRSKTLWEEDARATDAHRADIDRRWAEAAAELDAAQLQIDALETRIADRGQETIWALEDEMAGFASEIRLRRRWFLSLSLFGTFLSVILVMGSFQPKLHEYLSLPTLSAALCLFVVVFVVGNIWRVRSDRRDREQIDALSQELAQMQEPLERQDAVVEAALAREKAARQLFDLLSDQLSDVSFRSTETRDTEADLQTHRQQLALLQGRLQELGDPTKLEAALLETRQKLARLNLEYEALTLAIQVLSDAEQALRAGFSPRLSARCAQYFTRLTGGAYGGVILDRDFSARVEAAGSVSLRDSAVLSQGTTDQLYLALRLAICDLVLPDPLGAPLLLDDVLAAFDDRRAAMALGLLRELGQERQILLFSCHGREAKMLSGVEGVALHRLKG